MMKKLAILLIMSFFIMESIARKLNNNIFGGIKIPIKRAPYHVKIFIHDEYQCGGAIISSKFVVTAAHCFYEDIDNVSTSVKVCVGSHHLQKGKCVLASAFYLSHFFFDEINDRKLNLDIALLQLKYSVKESENVRYISLPCKPPEIGEKIILTGFGCTSINNNRSSKVLQFYNSIIIKCPEFKFYDDSDVCVETTTKKYACSGDSGSPLISEKNYELIGVLSRGFCNMPGPDIFANVYYQMNFIAYITKLKPVKCI